MRDPFENYDSWLERPYQEQYAREEEQEWIDEHSTFELECCGLDITEDEDMREVYEDQQIILTENRNTETWTDVQKKKLVFCETCNQWSLINKIEPDLPEDDGPEYEPPEELDDDPRNDYLNI